MMQEEVVKFAEEWIAAWNSHDLDRILSHYTDDFEMSSPLITRLADATDGKLKGKASVAAYWRKALDRFPDLQFELFDAFAGVDSVCIYYRSVLGLLAVECLTFNDSGKVTRAIAHYNRAPEIANTEASRK